MATLHPLPGIPGHTDSMRIGVPVSYATLEHASNFPLLAEEPALCPTSPSAAMLAHTPKSIIKRSGSIAQRSGSVRFSKDEEHLDGVPTLNRSVSDIKKGMFNKYFDPASALPLLEGDQLGSPRSRVLSASSGFLRSQSGLSTPGLSQKGSILSAPASPVYSMGWERAIQASSSRPHSSAGKLYGQLHVQVPHMTTKTRRSPAKEESAMHRAMRPVTSSNLLRHQIAMDELLANTWTPSEVLQLHSAGFIARCVGHLSVHALRDRAATLLAALSQAAPHSCLLEDYAGRIAASLPSILNPESHPIGVRSSKTSSPAKHCTPSTKPGNARCTPAQRAGAHLVYSLACCCANAERALGPFLASSSALEGLHVLASSGSEEAMHAAAAVAGSGTHAASALTDAGFVQAAIANVLRCQNMQQHDAASATGDVTAALVLLSKLCTLPAVALKVVKGKAPVLATCVRLLCPQQQQQTSADVHGTAAGMSDDASAPAESSPRSSHVGHISRNGGPHAARRQLQGYAALEVLCAISQSGVDLEIRSSVKDALLCSDRDDDEISMTHVASALLTVLHARMHLRACSQATFLLWLMAARDQHTTDPYHEPNKRAAAIASCAPALDSAAFTMDQGRACQGMGAVNAATVLADVLGVLPTWQEAPPLLWPTGGVLKPDTGHKLIPRRGLFVHGKDQSAEASFDRAGSATSSSCQSVHSGRSSHAGSNRSAAVELKPSAALEDAAESVTEADDYSEDADHEVSSANGSTSSQRSDPRGVHGLEDSTPMLPASIRPETSSTMHAAETVPLALASGSAAATEQQHPDTLPERDSGIATGAMQSPFMAYNIQHPPTNNIMPATSHSKIASLQLSISNADEPGPGLANMLSYASGTVLSQRLAQLLLLQQRYAFSAESVSRAVPSADASRAVKPDARKGPALVDMSVLSASRVPPASELQELQANIFGLLAALVLCEQACKAVTASPGLLEALRSRLYMPEPLKPPPAGQCNSKVLDTTSREAAGACASPELRAQLATLLNNMCLCGTGAQAVLQYIHPGMQVFDVEAGSSGMWFEATLTGALASCCQGCLVLLSGPASYASHSALQAGQKRAAGPKTAPFTPAALVPWAACMPLLAHSMGALANATSAAVPSIRSSKGADKGVGWAEAHLGLLATLSLRALLLAAPQGGGHAQEMRKMHGSALALLCACLQRAHGSARAVAAAAAAAAVAAAQVNAVKQASTIVPPQSRDDDAVELDAIQEAGGQDVDPAHAKAEEKHVGNETIANQLQAMEVAESAVMEAAAAALSLDAGMLHAVAKHVLCPVFHGGSSGAGMPSKLFDEKLVGTVDGRSKKGLAPLPASNTLQHLAACSLQYAIALGLLHPDTLYPQLLPALCSVLLPQLADRGARFCVTAFAAGSKWGQLDPEAPPTQPSEPQLRSALSLLSGLMRSSMVRRKLWATQLPMGLLALRNALYAQRPLQELADNLLVLLLREVCCARVDEAGPGVTELKMMVDRSADKYKTVAHLLLHVILSNSADGGRVSHHVHAAVQPYASRVGCRLNNLNASSTSKHYCPLEHKEAALEERILSSIVLTGEGGLEVGSLVPLASWRIVI